MKKFAGHIVSNEGICPDPEQLDTIRRFPTLKNQQDIRRFLGMANQLRSFMLDLSYMSKHVRELLKKNTAFNWLEDHKKEFTRMKNLLKGNRVVKPFNPKKHSTLVTDTSQLHGIGYALMQKDSDAQINHLRFQISNRCRIQILHHRARVPGYLICARED